MLLTKLFPQVNKEVEINHLRIDSRLVQRGDLFFAFKGSQQDGRHYIEQALLKGALAIVYDPEDYQLASTIAKQYPDAEFIALKNTQAHISGIASIFYNHPGNALSLIGVTGTNGKTTVTQLMAQALDLLGEHCGINGTVGTGFWGHLQKAKQTTPDAISMQACLAQLLNEGAKAVAMEVSSHGLDQGRVAALPFKVAIFTNLTRDHLDYHKTMENYGAAKAKLFEYPTVISKVINWDDAFGKDLIKLHQDKTLLTYSVESSEADLYCTDVHFSTQGIEAKLVTPMGQGLLKAKLIGHFNLSNVLAVVAGLLGLGYSLDKILAILPELSAPIGRMQCFGGETKPLVVVDYAHTPDALEKALAALKPHVKGKLWCVFGCGGGRDKGKRVLMAQAAEQLADQIVVTSDNPREENYLEIIDDILKGFTTHQQVQAIADRKKAISQSITQAMPEDIVLVAGKGHEDYQEVMGKRTHFSDIEEISQVLDAWENK